MQFTPLDDFHVHLRQSPLSEFVVPFVTIGGCRLAYVMPNLQPPITDARMANEYRKQLLAINPNPLYLMTLYLNPNLTPEILEEAFKNGVVGVKSYPKGVTTNSESGIEDYKNYYHIFSKMQELGMVLNLHGECPSNPEQNICCLNGEEKFLIHLEKLHKDFPRLKIVLEHATTQKAVEMVQRLGSTVACTITLHHLVLTVDDWAGQNFNFCKPVAKYPNDRLALQEVILSENPKFFLGTDSAPHLKDKKLTDIAPAGVFTSSHCLPYLLTILDQMILERNASISVEEKNLKIQRLSKNFGSTFGRNFYGDELLERAFTAQLKEIEYIGNAKEEWSDLIKLDSKKAYQSWKNNSKTIMVEYIENKVPEILRHGSMEIVPFLAQKILKYKISE